MPRRRPPRVALLLVAALLTALTACRRRPSASDARPGPDGEAAAAVKIVYPAAPSSFVELARKAARAVAHLYTDVPVRDGPADWFPAEGQRGTPLPDLQWQVARQRSLGSALIIDRAGHLLTNAHLADEQRALSVRLDDGRRFAVKLVGRDLRTDLALLKIEGGPDLPGVARLGDSDQLEVGEWVVALSNPFGLGHRVSAGVVSAPPRRSGPLDGYWGYIQTDIAINASNSGGPLLNTVGEVVGINTAIRHETGGLGLALPVNTVKRLLPALRRDGRVVRSYLGLYVEDLTAEELKALEVERGARITTVHPGGPADRAGLRQGDVIISFEGNPVTDARQLVWLAAVAGVDRLVAIKVWRDGKELSFTPRTARMEQ
jgi:serine protease Do